MQTTNSNIWNHLIACKPMNSNSFKNSVTYKFFINISYIFNIYLYKQNLILNDWKEMICHKTQPNQTKPKVIELFYSIHQFQRTQWLYQSNWLGLKNTQTVSLQRSKNPPMSVLIMTQNCIWWWGSSLGALGNMKYLFIAITPRSTLTWSGST